MQHLGRGLRRALFLNLVGGVSLRRRCEEGAFPAVCFIAVALSHTPKTRKYPGHGGHTFQRHRPGGEKSTVSPGLWGVFVFMHEHRGPSLAICITGTFRTLDHPRVQRSLAAILHGNPTAEVFTVVGLVAEAETLNAASSSNHSILDVHRAIDPLARNRTVHHHILTHREEWWTRCNNTMRLQFYKSSLCYRDVLAHSRQRGWPYEWVFKTRTDAKWEPREDEAFRRWPSAPQYPDSVVFTAPRQVQDFFILVRGSRLVDMMALPHEPCTAEDGIRGGGWGLFDSFARRHNLSVHRWAWPGVGHVGLEREQRPELIARVSWCKRHFASDRAGGVAGCRGLTSVAIDHLMRSPNSSMSRRFFAHQQAMIASTGASDTGGTAWEAALRLEASLESAPHRAGATWRMAESERLHAAGTIGLERYVAPFESTGYDDDLLSQQLLMGRTVGLPPVHRPWKLMEEMERVRQFLQEQKLGSYWNAFQANGYDDANFLMQLDANEAEIVAQTVGMKPGHAHKYASLATRGYSSLAKRNADLPLRVVNDASSRSILQISPPENPLAVVAMDWAKDAHASGLLPSTMLLDRDNHTVNYTLVYEDSTVSFQNIEKTYPHARILALNEHLCREWFDFRRKQGPPETAAPLLAEHQTVVMLPTTYTFACWMPDPAKLAAGRNSFTKVLSVHEAWQLGAIAALSGTYSDDCPQLSNLVFWPYALGFDYRPASWWASWITKLSSGGRWPRMRAPVSGGCSCQRLSSSCNGTGTLPYIFAGGQAGRDYDVLVRAIQGLPVRLYIYGRKRSTSADQQVVHMPPVDIDEFESAMDGALYVGVPLTAFPLRPLDLPVYNRNLARIRHGLLLSSGNTSSFYLRGKLVTGMTTVVQGLSRGKVTITTQRGHPRGGLWRDYLTNPRASALPVNDSDAWRNATIGLLESCARGQLAAMERRVALHSARLFAAESVAGRLNHLLSVAVERQRSLKCDALSFPVDMKHIQCFGSGSHLSFVAAAANEDACCAQCTRGVDICDLWQWCSLDAECAKTVPGCWTGKWQDCDSKVRVSASDAYKKGVIGRARPSSEIID